MNSQMEHLESKKDNTLTHLGENAEYQGRLLKLSREKGLLKQHKILKRMALFLMKNKFRSDCMCIYMLTEIMLYDQTGFIPGIQKPFNLILCIQLIPQSNRLKKKSSMFLLVNRENPLDKSQYPFMEWI